MALGINKIFTPAPWAQVEGVIAENMVGVGMGTWYDILGYYPLTLTVEGAFTGTVQIFVSNAPPPGPPGFAIDCPQLGDDITGPGSIIVNASWRYIRGVWNIATGTPRGIYLFAGRALTPRII